MSIWDKPFKPTVAGRTEILLGLLYENIYDEDGNLIECRDLGLITCEQILELLATLAPLPK